MQCDKVNGTCYVCRNGFFGQNCDLSKYYQFVPVHFLIYFNGCFCKSSRVCWKVNDIITVSKCPWHLTIYSFVKVLFSPPLSVSVIFLKLQYHCSFISQMRLKSRFDIIKGKFIQSLKSTQVIKLFEKVGKKPES